MENIVFSRKRDGAKTKGKSPLARVASFFSMLILHIYCMLRMTLIANKCSKLLSIEKLFSGKKGGSKIPKYQQADEAVSSCCPHAEVNLCVRYLMDVPREENIYNILSR